MTAKLVPAVVPELCNGRIVGSELHLLFGIGLRKVYPVSTDACPPAVRLAMKRLAAALSADDRQKT
jgi:hypothetical protein